MSQEEVYATMHGTQHATLEFRAYDNDLRGNMYDSNTDSDANDWETTGVYFVSATDEIYNMSVGNGGDFDVDIEVRSAEEAAQFAADGPNSVIIAVNADVATWDDITVDCGNTVEIQESQLTNEENDLWSNQEYFFQVNQPIEHHPKTTCNVAGTAKASPSSWKCPLFTFASRGNYIGTTSGTIELNSAAQDDSSNTNVYTVQTVGLRSSSSATDGTGCAASA
jgi:hypothetical protein